MSLRIPIPRGTAPGARPAAAVELAPGAVLAAATPSPGAPPVFAAEPLPPGAIVPGLVETNLPGAPAVSAAIRAALAAVSPRPRAVTVILPDSAVRVFVLDFDTLPSRAEDAMAVLRFRLRKSVPFDVEQAGISYQVLVEGSARQETPWKILAAILPGPVLAEYESVVRAAGYEPGAVLPASLAALAGLSSEEALLVAHLHAGSLTTTILSGTDILLHRTMDLDLDLPDFPAEFQRAIAVASAFFEDKLRAPARSLIYSGPLPVAEIEAILAGDDAPNTQPLSIIQIGANALGAVSSLGNRSVAALTGALAETR